ncbi:hypothetical protein [Arthrobacter sp. HS15c]|uniref:hypothetical protein n=1 Tax=Arthrobacter sp. HS15c TaxID=3230279 RepID=UPI003464FB08
MTPQASRLTDTVESMLLDAGQEQDTELRAALLSLGSLASLPVPSPNAQLAALLASRPDELTRRRRQRRHRNRSAIVGLAVVAGMGLGVTGVAATGSGAAGKTSLSVQHLLEDWAPSWDVSGLPAAAPAIRTVPEPAPAEPGAGRDAGPADGQQQYVAQEVPGQPAAPDATADDAAKEKPGDGGADAQAGSGSPGASGGVKQAKEQGKLPESSPSQEVERAPEPVRQTLEKTEKLLAGVVPGSAASKEAGNGSGKSGTNKKADPGAKWLKKFSR